MVHVLSTEPRGSVRQDAVNVLHLGRVLVNLHVQVQVHTCSLCIEHKDTLLSNTTLNGHACIQSNHTHQPACPIWWTVHQLIDWFQETQQLTSLCHSTVPDGDYLGNKQSPTKIQYFNVHTLYMYVHIYI